MRDQSFLLLHGWQNRRPPAHWQHWLAGELTALGHAVDYPQLPDPDEPQLDAWLDELRTRVAAMPGSRRTVLCHSLGCLLWLNAAARSAVPLRVDRVLLVAPPSPSITLSQPAIAGFAPPDVTPDQLSAAASYTRLVGTDNDPYFPEDIRDVFGTPLGVDTDILPGAAHLNMDSGYGPWPSALAWAVGPDDTPIQLRPTH
ncbi:alpha/beta hydrolase [Actinoplanes sp. DH11]|uniref:RBBP9/YdeN family alpha/beta hydrolase n=1 Tax=Actinoplanes sp. DH11 TaxID=2857011 RepID=UPI001E2F1D08|nr:alpha/beta hydrolase [Actinoplanes sp. DH11]